MKRKIVQHLLEIGAVSLQPNEPFTWSSGLKSPIYCDNRMTLSYPHIRNDIAKGFELLIREHYPEVEVIAGVATAGIAHAAFVSDEMELPMAYVRTSAKAHGKKKQIEGVVKPNQKVVLVEDLFSTGGSTIAAAKALREAEANVLGAVAIFTYGLEKAAQYFAEAGLSNHTISDFSTLLEVTDLSDLELEKVRKWHLDPDSDSWLD